MSDPVTPRAIDGWSISLHPGGPKFTIVCGNCGVVFRQRIPTGVNYPVIPCPHCHTRNRMPLVSETGEQQQRPYGGGGSYG